jgi:hypothetical protein
MRERRVRARNSGGQHRFDLQQCGLGRLRQPFAAERTHEARSDDQCFEFIGVEHQRRNVRTLAQHVADACFAFDRHAGQLQIGDVAIDRAQRHTERFGKPARG